MATTGTREQVWQFGRAYRTLLTTTGSTTVYTAPVGGRNRLLVLTAYASATAATTVSLTVNWTDPDTGADSYTFPTANIGPGNGGLFATLPFLAAAGSTVTVTATAGAANLVRVSVSARGN